MRGHDITNKNKMTKVNTKTMTKTILETFDIWDTKYNSDNWEPECMPIFVAWQLRVTLDSIRNSCDVFMLCVGFFGVWRWFYARMPVLNADISAFVNLISIYRTPLLPPEVVFSNCCHGVEIGSSVFWGHPLPPEVFFPLQIGGGLLDTLKYFEVQTQICWKDV